MIVKARYSVLLAALLLVGIVAITQTARADHNVLEVEDLTGTLAPEDLVTTLLGPAIDVVPGSVSFTGDNRAAGAFRHGEGIIGFGGGVVLSTGRIAHLVGPNTIRNSQPQGIQAKGSTILGRPGDAGLTSIVGQSTSDAAVLEFSFNAPAYAETLTFQYVFGSEEYLEWVGQFNDVFAFWVNGQNCALINGSPVSVNTVNTTVNSGAFIDNTTGGPFGFGHLNTELDGLTIVLTCEAPVTGGAVNTVKLAIADTLDALVDSAVFIEAGSLTFAQIDVDIDIKPGSDQNSINLGSGGMSNAGDIEPSVTGVFEPPADGEW